MIQSEQGLPEAIACGSDPMGLSIYEACKSRGIRVPEDIIITGYDATEESSNQPYFLTSIKLDVKTVGRNAVCILYNQLQNIRKVELFTSFEKIVMGHTCGCNPEEIKITESPLDFSGSLYDGNNLGFYSGHNFMLEDTIGAPHLTECLWKIDYYTKFLKDIESFHICLCSDWRGNPQDETKYRVDGYSQNILWVYDKKKDRHYDGTEGWVDLSRHIKREEILPIIWEEREKPSVFYITPIHFMDRCFGYAVLEYSSLNVSYEREYSSFMRNTNNAFEAMRRQMNLQDMNVKLSQMYRLMEVSAVTDSLTGLYNRNGFNIYAPELIEKAKLRSQNVLVFLADVNNLKKINDMYGHAEGDNAIVQASRAISGIIDSKDVSTLCFRIGGDEFVYLQIGEITEHDAEGLKLKIKKCLEEYNSSSGKAYHVMVSIGSSVGQAEGLHIDNLLQIADQKMYMEKAWYKNMYLNL
jgi:diguanylate cyclase (GGDEF)-like protein